MIVVDTNVIAYLLIQGPHTADSEDVYQRDADWHSPLLWRSEFLNVLSLAVRGGHLTLDESIEILAKAEILMAGKEHAVEPNAVLRLAVKSGCTAYDSEFAALAIDLDTILVTRDDKLLKAHPTFAKLPAAFTKR